MGATKPTWTILNRWDKTVLYAVSWNKLTVNVEVETVKDAIGYLKRVNSSVTNDFETYGMQSVKDKVNDALMIK